MKFALTKFAALAAMAFATTGAHAALDMSGLATLSIENDAVTTFGVDPSGSPTASAAWYISSDGALVDSFFTMGGSKSKLALDTQYAYIDGTTNLINLNGSNESGVGTWTYYGAPGSNGANAVTMGTGGISILSATGDTAKLDMSGWKIDWGGLLDWPMGTGAWSVGYTSGVGNLTCTAGSGCAVGSAYTLKYTATVPIGDPSGFGGVKYYLELHGCIMPAVDEYECSIPASIPEASTYAMMLAGLGVIGVVARRRRV